MKNKFKNLFNAKALIKIDIILLLIIFALPIYGCKKEDVKTDDPIVVVEDPVQYGTPFNKVPKTSDIVMYEVNLRAFSEAGNIKGVQERLDNLKDLGVNVIWLMPIYPIGEVKSVNSPYSVRNYKEVSSEYGNLENLREFVKEAHKRDMAVILDWVANHTSWDNPWIANKNWYTHDATGNIVSPNGWNDVADLNYGSLAMRREMIKAMKYWVLTANVDGFRCDYADGVPVDFWKEAIGELRDIPNRDLILFAEGVRPENFSAGFALNFGWNFYGTLKDVFNKNEPASKLSMANETDYKNIPSNSHMLRFTTNHDDNSTDNTPVNIFKGKQGSMAAFALTSYMGGVPLLYTGQEVGCEDKIPFFTNYSLDWSTNPEMTEEYKRLITFRKSSNAVKNGSLTTYNNNPDIAAFKRVSGSEEVLVLVNVRENPIDYTLDASLENTAWKDAFTNSAINMGTKVSLGPFSYMILKN